MIENSTLSTKIGRFAICYALLPDIVLILLFNNTGDNADEIEQEKREKSYQGTQRG